MPQNKQENTSFMRHRPFYKTSIFWLIIAILVIVGSVFAIIELLKEPDDLTSEPESVPTTSESVEEPTKKTEEKTKDTESESSSVTNSSASPDGKTPTQYDGDDPNLENSLTGFLSTARFSEEKLIIRVAIDQYLSGGTCTLTLSDGTNQLEKTSKLIPDVSTSTCEGFDIANFELSDFARPISIEINLLSGNKTGTISGRVE